MSKSYFFNPDIQWRNIKGRWIVSNPRLRTHVELEKEMMVTFVRLASEEVNLSEEKYIQDFGDFRCRNVTVRGIGSNGLHADHSCLNLNSKDSWLSGRDSFLLLLDKAILLNDFSDQNDRMKPLLNVVDQKNLGTFHQRIGQYLVLEKRSKIHWREWHDQKFSPDGKKLLDGPYKNIQEPFFDNFFTEERIKEYNILDFGCGNAYYTSHFAQRAKSVLGIDNSEELINIARENHGHLNNLSLMLTKTFDELMSRLRDLPAESFDMIYLQDTLLLLIQPEFPVPDFSLHDLLIEFKRLLKKDGRIYSMEPNACFWLAGRYGNDKNPFALITEYRNPVFNVAPTLDILLDHMSSAGFSLYKLRNPYPAVKKDYEYQAEFPIWDFYEFVKVN